MYIFGKVSQENLSEIHPDLKLIMDEALKVSDIDFGIHEGSRTIEKQLDYFLQGKSKLDPRRSGVLAHAKHVIFDAREKAEAIDLHIASKENAWDREHLCFVAGVITSTAHRLYSEGKILHLIRWGGNWDRDGVILKDQSFHDLPHFELYKP